MGRITKTQYYFDIAMSVAQRATCLRRIYGSVIVVNDQVVSTGYCGAPRGVRDCHERKECFRRIKNIPSGQRYELCRSVHAEQNAIINAARAGVSVFGGTIYIYGYDWENEMVCSGYPCLMCMKTIINAGLEKVYFKTPEIEKGYAGVDIPALIQFWNAGDIFNDKEE